MTLNFTSDLKRFHEITYFCHKSVCDTVSSFVTSNNLVDRMLPVEDYDSSHYDKTINLVGYPLAEGYPKTKMKRHLLWYFAHEMGVPFSFDSFLLSSPPPPEFIQIRHAGQNEPPRYFTVQTKTGWSAYKEWWGWSQLLPFLRNQYPDVSIYQIGGPSDPILDGVDGSLCGAPFEDNVAAQAHALLHLGLDSVLNHTTNIHWRGRGKVPAVILFGSTQADASGYPHNTNLSLNLSCQPCFREDPAMTSVPLGPCVNPPGQTYENPRHCCMQFITPAMVSKAVASKLPLPR